jgi:hypothetical protein
MKRFFVFLVLGVMAILVGCPSPHNITIADFVGTWTATTWTQTELPPNGPQVVNALSGGSLKITINPDGSYTAYVNGGAGIPGTATIIDNSTMTIMQAGKTLHLTYTLSGNTWIFTTSDDTYAFTDGTHPSRQDITALRS